MWYNSCGVEGYLRYLLLITYDCVLCIICDCMGAFVERGIVGRGCSGAGVVDGVPVLVCDIYRIYEISASVCLVFLAQSRNVAELIFSFGKHRFCGSNSVFSSLLLHMRTT